MSPFYILIILGVLSIIFLIFLLIIEKGKMTTPLYGVFVVSVLLLGIGILKPSMITLGDLKMRISKIEEKIRPFAIIEIEKKSGKVVHSTFQEGKFKLVTLSVEEGYVKFFIEGKSDFVNITANGYNQFSVHPILSKESDSGTVYTAYWIKHGQEKKYKLEKLFIETVLR